MGSGLEGLDFSHQGVKRVVGLLIGFVSVIASAPHCFLYLKQQIHDNNKKKKRRKKKKEKKAPYVLPSFSSAPPPAIEISTPWEIIMRVFSASDLPRPWPLLLGLSPLHPLTFSGAFGLPSRGFWIPFWFRSSLLSIIVLMCLPFTLHFATCLA